MNVLRLHTKKPLLMENDDLSPDSATSIEHLWKAGLGREERRVLGRWVLYSATLACGAPPSSFLLHCRQHVRQEEGQEFKDNMDELLKDVWLRELQGAEGCFGWEGGAKGETSLCRSGFCPTGQEASKNTLGQLNCIFFLNFRAEQ